MPASASVDPSPRGLLLADLTAREIGDRPPIMLYLTALETRLTRIWENRCRSA